MNNQNDRPEQTMSPPPEKKGKTFRRVMLGVCGLFLCVGSCNALISKLRPEKTIEQKIEAYRKYADGRCGPPQVFEGVTFNFPFEYLYYTGCDSRSRILPHEMWMISIVTSWPSFKVSRHWLYERDKGRDEVHRLFGMGSLNKYPNETYMSISLKRLCSLNKEPAYNEAGKMTNGCDKDKKSLAFMYQSYGMREDESYATPISKPSPYHDLAPRYPDIEYIGYDDNYPPPDEFFYKKRDKQGNIEFMECVTRFGEEQQNPAVPLYRHCSHYFSWMDRFEVRLGYSEQYAPHHEQLKQDVIKFLESHIVEVGAFPERFYPNSSFDRDY